MSDIEQERWFVHLDNVWRVLEVERTVVDGVVFPSVLIFDEPMSVRLVHRYPANWRELSDAELVALSWE
jgi:hypothetical protein